LTLADEFDRSSPQQIPNEFETLSKLRLIDGYRPLTDSSPSAAPYALLEGAGWRPLIAMPLGNVHPRLTASRGVGVSVLTAAALVLAWPTIQLVPAGAGTKAVVAGPIAELVVAALAA
jgi:hypothetical protein